MELKSYFQSSEGEQNTGGFVHTAAFIQIQIFLIILVTWTYDGNKVEPEEMLQEDQQVCVCEWGREREKWVITKLVEEPGHFSETLFLFNAKTGVIYN